MKNFLRENFMLESETAQYLYSAVKDLPIIDYHCHINPKDIAEDKRYDNLAEIWLTCGDHYKWRAVRSNGIDENYITGDASDYEKFAAFARTLPKCIGNPLYIWAHMELRKYFNIQDALNEKSCKKIWDIAEEQLNGDSMTAREIMKKSNVRLICTTDDPIDSLEYHRQIAAIRGFDIKVLPAFRPDKGLHIEKAGFADYIKKLGEAAGIEITSLNDLFSAYESRIKFFVGMGCKTADNGFENVPFKRGNADEVFKKALSGEEITQEEIDIYKTELFLFLGEQYRKNNLVMQIHFGVSRNNSTRLWNLIGADAGADAIGNYNCIMNLTLIMNELDKNGSLPKTVLYSINPADNAAIGALIGCFQNADTNVKGIGKIQHGSAWWFNDTNLGMRTHIKNLAEFSLLGNFIGMLTDSRSFLSYTRHDYFRRILCDIIGSFVENGEYPNDREYLSGTVKNICYFNAKNYFEFPVN